MEERQKIAAAAGDDTDVLAWYAEPPQVAVNLFHLRGGRVVDRRDFYWEDLEEFDPAEFLPSLLKQLYLDAAYLPRFIHTPMDFEDRELLEEVLDRKSRASRGNPESAARAETRVSRAGREERAAFVSCSVSACCSQLRKAIAEALESALGLPEPPKRIECFDISHIQGSDTVASMVVWEDGRMKKSDYRKFIIRGEAMPEGAEKCEQRHCCATISPACAKSVERRYRRCRRRTNRCPA